MTKDKKITELKTSAFDRRMSIAKASLKVGGKWATSSATSVFLNKEKKDAKRQQFIKEQAEYLVSEIGKLKGSVVKIGQMMALYGEHILPPEITEALHSLNDSTSAISWSQLQPHVQQVLGAHFDDLIINPEPLGTASLAQVHKAIRKSDGLELVLKIQYPGVAEAIDSDLKLFKSLIKMTNVVPQTREFEEWFTEIQQMLHKEVDYVCEAETTQRFYNRLKSDNRYIVPQIIQPYCSEKLIAMTYEAGVPVNSSAIINLPQARKNNLGEAALEIVINELFDWGEMQTDPNFGNYLIRLAENETDTDKIILLDFGAMRVFDDKLLTLAKGFMTAGNQNDKSAMLNAMQGYEFFANLPDKPKNDMADTFLLATEPFRLPNKDANYPTKLLDENNNYIWADSNLHNRITSFVAKVAKSKYFAVPPKEFMFISRKFIGAYTFMTVIDARTQTFNFVKQKIA